MVAQEPKEKDHNAVLADLLGSCVKQGFSRIGSSVVFTVCQESADRVFLVGSFNGWTESHPLKKTNSDIWQILLSDADIKDGDTYKLKVYHEGLQTYIADPYAVENEGAPHFNSVYRCVSDDMVNTYKTEKHAGFINRPMNIYSVRADVWNGGSHQYSDMAQDLIPYMMQMGYTHLCLSGVFEEYYEFSSNRTLKANFAPRKEQGGIDGLRGLVHLMHNSGIGVLLDRGITDVSERVGTHEHFLADGARYWLDLYGFDGLVSSATSERSAEVLSRVYGLLKEEYKNAYFIDRELCSIRISGADAVLGDYDRVLTEFTPTENGSLDLCARMAAMSYVLISSGKGFTSAGCELGIAPTDAREKSSDLSIMDKNENFYFQLFISDLNALYLANSGLWSGTETINVQKQGDALIAECCAEEGSVFFAADASGRGCEIDIPFYNDEYVALDSCSERYGGKGQCTPYKPCANRLALGPYGAVVLIGERTE